MKKQTVFYCLFLAISSAHSTEIKERIPDVTIKHRAIKPSLSGGVKHVITQHMMALSGATSLLDVLRASGEMQILDASGTGSQAAVGMRGFGANAGSNSLILLNGIPLTNPDIAPPDLNTLPLEAIRAIEITAGSESVLYGDQAVGGIVNIITDQSKDKSLRIQCDTGSYHARDCRIRAVNYYRDINYQLGAFANSTDNYRAHNHYLNETLSAALQSKNAVNEYHADFKVTHENMQYPGALTAAQVAQNRRQASNDTDFFKDNNQFLQLQQKHQINEHWVMKTSAFINDMNGNGVLFAPFTQSRKSGFLKPSLLYKSEYFQIQSGIDAKLDRYHLGSAFGITDNNQKQGGIFVLLNTKLHDIYTFTIGARGAAQSTQLTTASNAYTLNRALAATIGVAYQYSEVMSLYLRRAGSFRFPKAEENSATGQPLRVQRGISYETGVRYENADRILHLALYRLDLRDEISFDPFQTPQNPFGSNQNLAPTSRLGASITASKDLRPHLRGDVQLNYVHARFQSGIYDGNRIPLVADFIARAGLLYRWHEHWNFYLEGIFTSNQFAANDNANITAPQGGYTIYNANVRYQYENLTLAFHMNNIFNKYYYLSLVYQPGMSAEYFYPAPDRNIMLTASYTFL